MTKEELTRRLQACNETIEKKKNLIVKKNNQIEKLVSKMHGLGYDGNDYDSLKKEVEEEREINFKGDKFQEGYNLVYDIYSDLESIKNANKAIIEENKKIEKYNAMMDIENKKNNELDNLPECLITFMNELKDSWNAFDKSKRDRCKELYKEYKAKDLDYYSVEYKEFHKMMKEKFGNYYELMRTTDEMIEKENDKAVKSIVIDLIKRVKDKVGTITSTDHLYINQNNAGYAILNGYVEGTDGHAKVESIYAGGYNIQRLHVRVLVK